MKSNKSILGYDTVKAAAVMSKGDQVVSTQGKFEKVLIESYYEKYESIFKWFSLDMVESINMVSGLMSTSHRL